MLCVVSTRCDRGWTEHLHHLIYDPLSAVISLDYTDLLTHTDVHAPRGVYQGRKRLVQVPICLRTYILTHTKSRDALTNASVE